MIGLKIEKSYQTSLFELRILSLINASIFLYYLFSHSVIFSITESSLQIEQYLSTKSHLAISIVPSTLNVFLKEKLLFQKSFPKSTFQFG